MPFCSECGAKAEPKWKCCPMCTTALKPANVHNDGTAKIHNPYDNNSQNSATSAMSKVPNPYSNNNNNNPPPPQPVNYVSSVPSNPYNLAAPPHPVNYAPPVPNNPFNVGLHGIGKIAQVATQVASHVVTAVVETGELRLVIEVTQGGARYAKFI